MAAISLARNARRFMTACNEYAMLRGLVRSLAVHSCNICFCSALERVVRPKSSFTAMGVKGAGLNILTIWARKAYFMRLGSFSLVAVVFISVSVLINSG